MKLMPFTADIRQQLIEDGYGYFIVNDFADEFSQQKTITLKAVQKKPESGIPIQSKEITDLLHNNARCYVMLL